MIEAGFIDDVCASDRGLHHITNAPEGVDCLILSAWLARKDLPPLLIVTRDDKRLAMMQEQLRVFAPNAHIAMFPAWDCAPYDFLSPRNDIIATRMGTLCDLAARICGISPCAQTPDAVITTIAALTQRVPPPDILAQARLTLCRGKAASLPAIMAFLSEQGYHRVETVCEPGEYAPRGGLLDVFPPGLNAPLRLDFFGDQLESLRNFDPISQRTTGKREAITLLPGREFPFDRKAIERFRTGYRALFETQKGQDILYESVSAGQEIPGLAHWSPLFHAKMATLFAYMPGAVVALDAHFEEALPQRLETIQKGWESRMGADSIKSKEGVSHENKGLPPHSLYLDSKELEGWLEKHTRLSFTPYALPPDLPVFDMEGRAGANYTAVAGGVAAVWKAIKTDIAAAQANRKTVIIASRTPQRRARIKSLLEQQGCTPLRCVDDWESSVNQQGHKGEIALLVLPIEQGFIWRSLIVIAEADISGMQAIPVRRRRRAEDIIAEASNVSIGDLVVHIEHGVGCYQGLETLTIGGAEHDCLALRYRHDDKLYVPVENIDLLSRYGGDLAEGLDRLGSASWQARKAKVKNRLRDMAGALITVAANRAAASMEAMIPDTQGLSGFCRRFPYAETEDQEAAIQDVLHDMAKTRPMDRLVCGDVGFGKTEVALRAAYVAVETGHQVALVCPTTLLCRQHAKTFRERFSGFNVKIGVLSRFTSRKEASHIHEELKSGKIGIVIATHALLSQHIAFSHLGLVIIDEEQHFGVGQKEKLKTYRGAVHVLTLSATPIPRTLQLSMAGVRDLSLIASPPVNRLAVRTFVLPRDRAVIREALNREKARGGQSFYICPRIKDLAKLEAQLEDIVPNLTWQVAHGRLSGDELERKITDFHKGNFDILLSTSIVESGLDFPMVNTMIVERADLFGLSQLYQLRGRIGRSDRRGYAYFILPSTGGITPQAEKRLEVLHRLDTLGAGFALASYDLDIRGAGNLLGGEQSGHIREVGIELYQRLLEEAVAESKGEENRSQNDWTPQINIGVPVMIPEDYIADLGVRLSLYRRLGRLRNREEIDAFADELADRFGPLPAEVENLIRIIIIKRHCFSARITKLDAGPKGATLSFYNNEFTNPLQLIDDLGKQGYNLRFKSDHRVVIPASWPRAETRLQAVGTLIHHIADMVTNG